MDNPKPLPCAPFVVKNGSKQRRRISSVMPMAGIADFEHDPVAITMRAD
jgi:hypothetical protein